MPLLEIYVGIYKQHIYICIAILNCFAINVVVYEWNNSNVLKKHKHVSVYYILIKALFRGKIMFLNMNSISFSIRSVTYRIHSDTHH